MLIRGVIIERSTAFKIYEKHSVLSSEVEAMLKKPKTIFRRVGANQYVAVGLGERYLTVFFRYDNTTREAEITTAYPSSRKQIKSYKRLSR